MRRPMLSAALIAIAMQGCAPALDWREVHPEGTAAALLFPCHPKSQSRQAMLAGARVRMTLLACDAEGLSFGLVHADLGDPALVAPALDAMAAALAGNLQAVQMRSAPLQVAGMTSGQGARRIRLDGRLPDATPVQVQAALFASGAHVYQASVLGARPDPSADVFFDSLRLAP